MTRSKMPPQAYTRETLASAYEWLSHQPPSIHELATSADRLVGLYLQSRRRNSEDLPEDDSAPVSSKAFKSQLKDLARVAENFIDIQPDTDMGDHYTPTPIDLTSSPSPLAQTPVTPAPQPIPQTSQLQTPPTSTEKVQSFKPTPPPQRPTQSPPKKSAPTLSSSIPADTTFLEMPGLDKQTQETLSTVRRQLNLSSETEALRMLVTLGYAQISELLPKN